MSIQEIEDLKQHYLDEVLSLSNDLGIKNYRNEKIDIRFRSECDDMIDELKGKFNKKKELRHLKQVANLSTYYSQRFRSFCYNDDDDYEESTIPLNKDISQEPPSNTITPVLPTLEPKDSLIMGNEELNTIPEKESNEFIKSSVEDLVPILRESEDTSGSDSECILPSCDDFSPINISEEKFVTFSNPLFYDDFTSSDDESLSDEDVLEENDIECKDSYDSNLDESTFLVTPLSDSNEDEYFAPGDDVELLLHRDPSTPKMSVISILEGFTDEPPLEENDDLFDLESRKNDWKKILIARMMKTLVLMVLSFDNSNGILADSNMDLVGGRVEQHPATIEETRALYESLYYNLVIEVEKFNTINRETREANEKLIA
nr:hypothetical protein [Tanacetum cinerariifolium]